MRGRLDGTYSNDNLFFDKRNLAEHCRWLTRLLLLKPSGHPRLWEGEVDTPILLRKKSWLLRKLYEIGVEHSSITVLAANSGTQNDFSCFANGIIGSGKKAEENYDLSFYVVPF